MSFVNNNGNRSKHSDNRKIVKKKKSNPDIKNIENEQRNIRNIDRKSPNRKNINQGYQNRKNRDEGIKRGNERPPKIVDLEKKKKRRKRIITIFLILYGIFCIYATISYFSWRSLALPMLENQNSVVVDQNGNVIETLGAEKKQSNVELSEVPENLKNAYIDIEDERFYSHKGIDIKRTTAAIGSYIIHGGKSSFGGSTITQQLVKNMTGNDDNSISRKVGEWGRAIALETFSSKDQILESYMNIIYVAPNTYGVKMGARYYFDKDVQDLDLAECAFLAGINNSPNSYNPFKNSDNADKIKTRSKAVLAKMLEHNDITKDEYDSAVQEIENGLNFKNGEIETSSNGVYSYHTDAVISEVVSEIAKKKNIDTTFATNYVYMAGLKIYSTEDTQIQEKLEDEYNKEKYVITSESGQQSQSAMVIMDHETGQVVACVGGLGEKTTSRGFNRATQAVRQTGSAIKPIAVLAPGIDQKKFSATTMYNDEPTTFNEGTEDEYSPTDNDDYIGEITVRRAVESSQNIPFVKMMESVTPKTSIKYLKKMGITSLTENDETLSLALGGLDKGITPLEMAAAYATIANDGEYIEPTFYTKVENSQGKTIMKTKQKTTRVFSKEVAGILKELLKQPVEGSNGTAKICKIQGMDVAAKTGTTNDNYDKWLCGFTTYYTAVTWYGYDTNESIVYKGKSPAAQLWSNVMTSVHEDLSKTQFEISSKIKTATICSKTGHIANSNCADTYTEYFLSGTLPSQCVGCNSSTKQNNSKNNNTENKTNTKNNTNTQNSIVENNTNTENNKTNEVNNTTNIVNNKTTDERNSSLNNTTTNNIKNNTNSSTNTTNTNNVNKNNTVSNNTVKNEVNPTEDEEDDDGP